jgi:hypothetical protein
MKPTCLTCIFCNKQSARVIINPYNGKQETHVDCWHRHTWNDAARPCNAHATKIGPT